MINFNDDNIERQTRRYTNLKKKNEDEIYKALGKYMKSAANTHRSNREGGGQEI